MCTGRLGYNCNKECNNEFRPVRLSSSLHDKLPLSKFTLMCNQNSLFSAVIKGTGTPSSHSSLALEEIGMYSYN